MKKWNKSVEQLEKDIWKLNFEYPSELIEKVHIYRKVPIQYLTIEQLRFLTSQSIGLNHIIERIIFKLKNDILAKGDYYKGDLLVAISKVSLEEWLNNKNEFIELFDLVESNSEYLINTLSKRDFKKIYSNLMEKRKYLLNS